MEEEKSEERGGGPWRIRLGRRSRGRGRRVEKDGMRGRGEREGGESRSNKERGEESEEANEGRRG